MQSVIMSTKGQVIIPARIRKKYGLKKGKKLVLIEEEGYIKMLPPVDLTKLCGSWPDLDLEAVRKEIEESRKDDEEREKQIEEAIKKR